MTEGITTEFKREYTDEIKKTVVAFANTSGGELLIGVEDDGSVIGVPDVDGTMLKATNAMRDSIKPDITMFLPWQPAAQAACAPPTASKPSGDL